MKLLHNLQFVKRDKINKNYHHDWSNEHTEEEGDARGKKKKQKLVEEMRVLILMSQGIEIDNQMHKLCSNKILFSNQFK